MTTEAKKMMESLGEAKEADTLRAAMVKHFEARAKEHPGNVSNDFAQVTSMAVRAAYGDDGKRMKIIRGNLEDQFQGFQTDRSGT